MFIKLNLLIVLSLAIKHVSNQSAQDGAAQRLPDVVPPLVTASDDKEDKNVKSIAIIGCGVGGSSASYFLSQLAKQEPSVKIAVDCFEKKAEVGGRLATATLNGHVYETGGSIIHERNHYAKMLTERLGLKRRSLTKEEDKLCLFNGKTFDFCESTWSVVTWAKILLRYGFQVQKMQSRVEKIIDSFEKIYKLQEYSVKFQNVDDLLDAMSPSVQNLTKTRYKDYLRDNGFSKKFAEELCQAISLVNYGQDLSIHAFVGCVSFAGAGAQLWAISGGNKLLVKRLLESSSSVNILLETTVQSVTREEDNHYSVEFTYRSGQTGRKKYSAVIVATPLTEGQLKFGNFSVNLSPDRRYHRTVATLVSGQLQKKFRGRQVLSDNKSSFFTSVARVHPVDDSSDDPKPVYKVFSAQPLSTEQLEQIFSTVHSVHVTDWFAYPEYSSPSLALPSFVLSEGVYHVNAIEWSASAIEMSLIGGRNAALLVWDHLGGETSDVWSKETSGRQKKKKKHQEL